MENHQSDNQSRIPAPSADQQGTPNKSSDAADSPKRSLDENRFPNDMVPRLIPTSVKIAWLGRNLFGWFGSVFFAFGILFCSIFLSNADFGSAFRSEQWGEAGTATITQIEATSAQVNNRYVMAFHFSYRGRNGIAGKGISYSTQHDVAVGDQMKVQYDKDDPEMAILEGMRKSEFGTWVLFVLLFPLIGFFFVLIPSILRYRKLKFLRWGTRHHALYLRSRDSNIKVNNRPLKKHTFAYLNQRGETCEGDAGIGELEDSSADFTLLSLDGSDKVLVLEIIKPKMVIKDWGEVSTNGSMLHAAWMLIFSGALLVSFLILTGQLF